MTAAPTILTVGAGGFVAGRIAARLEREFPRAHALSRRRQSTASLDRCSVYDPSNITAALESIQPQIIVYTPGRITPGDGPADLAGARLANIVNPIRCMTYLAQRRGDGCFVFLNSYAIYHPAYPKTFYTASKKTAQRELRRIAREHPKVLLYDLIVHDLYAEDDPRDKILHRLLQAFRGQRPLTIDHPQNRLSFVHLDDFTDTLAAICRAPSPDHCQGPRAVRGDEDIPLAELARRISALDPWKDSRVTIGEDPTLTCWPAAIDPLPIHRNTVRFSDVLERLAAHRS